MTRVDAPSAIGSKHTAMLLRDARAVLRKVDALVATASTIGDPSVREVAELRASAEQVVAHLAHRAEHEQRRSREAARRNR